MKKTTYLFLLLVPLTYAMELHGQHLKTKEEGLCCERHRYKQTLVFRGSVKDKQNGKPLEFATIQLVGVPHSSCASCTNSQRTYGAVTDEKGLFHISGIRPGTYQLLISYLGFEGINLKKNITSNLSESFLLSSSLTTLKEVIVTASESKQATSASVIDRTAMKHLQPNSFTDLLELLPGGKTVDPQMGQSNFIRIREAGTSAGISSLGVGFYIDGVQQQTDAHLQYVPGSTSNVNGTGAVAKGVDMRTISTDNIEKVEIIRGIPSVAYGNVSNGAVIIQRKNSESPLSARFKADKNSKLLSIGKGMRLNQSGNLILNTDISYLYATTDPRNSVKNYSRATGSLRLNGKHQWSEREIRWNVNADYTGSFDKAKRDKDATIKEDAYQTDYNQLKLAGKWRMRGRSNTGLQELSLSASIHQQWEKMRDIRSVSLNRPIAIATRRESGAADGIYLPFNYQADLLVDGKPFYLSGAIQTKWKFPFWEKDHCSSEQMCKRCMHRNIRTQCKHRQPAPIDNLTMVGLEWNYQKNLGEGHIFDVTRPLNENISTRPRRFKDIPGLQPLAFYAEETVKIPTLLGRVDVSAGIRLQTLLGLDNRYEMQGQLYPDFRTNFQLHFPTSNEWQVSLSGGLGWMSRMPTAAQLFPNDQYVDLVQLNYYHEQPTLRRIHLMTYHWDNTNYGLKPARNRKWEVRGDIAYQGNRLSVTYFRERMNEAFGDLTYVRSLPYQKYNPSGMDDSQLTAPPALDQLTSTTVHNLDVYTQPGNTLMVQKEGIEFQFASKRWDLLKTRATIYGAWIKTTYRTNAPQYKTASILLNNKQFHYAGLYTDKDGSVNQAFNTNFVLDTYLQRLDFTFSTSVQCSWFSSRQNLWISGIPTNYIDETGHSHPFLEEDKTHAYLQHLVSKFSDTYFERNVVPFSMNVNLKASKQVGRNLHLSFFVNRILGIYPTYTLHGVVQRRSAAPPYFGMEMSVTI